MYTNIEIFKNDFKQESASTIKLLKALTNESLAQKVWAEGRTLGEIAWHTVLSVGEMVLTAGLPINADPEAENPDNVEEYLKFYTYFSTEALELITKNWTNEMLEEEVPMYGQSWSRGLVLAILLRHQTHHRGQMTVLMRQAGIKVPGMYGPSKEEWKAYGMPAQK